MDVGVCLDDLINAKSIPNVVGLPMATALGGMGFADRLLDPTYYETVEAMLTKLYKKYGYEYEHKSARLKAFRWSRRWTKALRDRSPAVRYLSLFEQRIRRRGATFLNLSPSMLTLRRDTR